MVVLGGGAVSYERGTPASAWYNEGGFPGESSQPANTTRGSSTTLASKVNVPHIIHFEALCGANLVT